MTPVAPPVRIGEAKFQNQNQIQNETETNCERIKSNNDGNNPNDRSYRI